MRYLSFLILFMSSWAQAQEGAAEQPSFIVQMVPFIAMITIFYFLMIRPQANKQKAHVDLLQSLQKGDEVLTTGGLMGTIDGLTDRFVTLKVADSVKLRVLRTHISNKVQQEVKK